MSIVILILNWKTPILRSVIFGFMALASPTHGDMEKYPLPVDCLFSTRARWTGDLNRGARSDQLRIVRFGDSYAYDLREWLKGLYGDGGSLFSLNGVESEMGSGATLVSQLNSGTAAPDSYSTTFLYAEVPINGWVLFGRRLWEPWHPPIARQLVVYYVARTGGGIFKVQVDTDASGIFTDVPGAVINTDNGSEETISRWTHDLGPSGQGRYRIRVIGTSGTSRILFGGTEQWSEGDSLLPSGCLDINLSMGGTRPPDWDSVSQINYTRLLADFDPHIIFICCAETLADLQNYWPSVVSKLKTAAPLADIVIFGSHPTYHHPDPGYKDPADEFFSEWCEQNNEVFVDCRHLFPSWQRDDDQGKAIYADNVHLTAEGFRIKGVAGTNQLRWLRAGRLPRIIKVEKNQGQFSILWSGGTNAYVQRSQSLDQNSWVTVSSNDLTGYFFENSSGSRAFYRLMMPIE